MEILHKLSPENSLTSKLGKTTALYAVFVSYTHSELVPFKSQQKNNAFICNFEQVFVHRAVAHTFLLSLNLTK